MHAAGALRTHERVGVLSYVRFLLAIGSVSVALRSAALSAMISHQLPMKYDVLAIDWELGLYDLPAR